MRATPRALIIQLRLQALGLKFMSNLLISQVEFND